MLTMKSGIKNAMLIAAALPWCFSCVATAQSLPSFRIKGRVDEEKIASAVANARIQAYDLSPDGSRVALFVASGDLVQAPTWVLIARSTDSTILSQIPFGAARLASQGNGPQVAFTPDGKLLVVHDSQTVSILETSTLAKMRTITPTIKDRLNVPVRIVMASKSNAAAISFGTGDPVLNSLDKRPVQTEMVDVSTGKPVGTWESDDLPMSVSPNADFVALSDHSSTGAVMGVVIVESKSGKKVATLSARYVFTEGETRQKFAARMTAKFISNDEVILTPDGNVDQWDDDGGPGIKIVRFQDSKVVQEIRPQHYGPTGEIAVSADQNDLITLSLYLPPKYRTHPHWRIPKDSGPKLMVLSNQAGLKMDSVTQMSNMTGLRTFTMYDWAGLRVSADGSSISVAQDHGITIFARK